MKEIGYEMLYLLSCVLGEVKPNQDRVANMDLEKLYKISKYHSLTALVCVALESAGIRNEKFMQAKSKSVRKNILLDAEREKICDFMEQNGIWHMPLKGVILKELYPQIGMRQMADNDILYDKEYQTQLESFMKSSGYTAESVGKSNHDIYMKPPIYNFELHTDLFGENRKPFYEYYSDVKKRLIKDNNKEYFYHFTDEDFYVYITAHEYKHYKGGGTGLRSLVDCYVYTQKKGDLLDWEYIKSQTEKLGFTEFEQDRRKLCEKVFSTTDFPKLSDKETEMLEYYLFSGTYGTQKNLAENRIQKFKNEEGVKSKIGYMLKRLFPDMDFYRMHYPFFYRHKFLLPVGWLFRLLRGVTIRRKHIKCEMDALKKSDL